MIKLVFSLAGFYLDPELVPVENTVHSAKLYPKSVTTIGWSGKPVSTNCERLPQASSLLSYRAKHCFVFYGSNC